MIAKDLPLLDLFIRLRDADLPLGIDDYYLFLKALQAGFGITDKEALGRLCRMLWIKSAEEEHVFDDYFSQFMINYKDNELASQFIEHNLKEADPVMMPEVLQPARNSEPNVQSPRLSTQVESEALLDPMYMKVEDEVQIAKAVLLADTGTTDIPYNSIRHDRKFFLSDEYFPVTRRQMKQSWRYLRHSVHEGPSTELDIEASVKKFGRNGMLLEPVYIPRRINRVEVVLLIDQDGSMVPFHALSRRLIETAQRGGQLGKVHVYYFHNCPAEYIYRSPTRQEAVSLQEAIKQLNNEHTGILIFSDAGAARGGYKRERIDITQEFIRQLRLDVRSIAWLNPVPEMRWKGSSAEEIMQYISMADTSRQGLDAVISVLRGRIPKYIRSTRYKYHG